MRNPEIDAIAPIHSLKESWGKMRKIQVVVLVCLMASGFIGESAAISFENEYVQYTIGPDGKNQHFIDKKTGRDYCDAAGDPYCAWVKAGGRDWPASGASFDGNLLRLDFGECGVQAWIKITIEKRFFRFEVIEAKGDRIESLTFLNAALQRPGDPLAGCALALNLKTNVPELPQANSRVRAICYSRFGLAGAEAAFIGCPQSELRRVMQEVVSQSPDLPHSTIGGPWALDAPINKGSYLFNFSDLSEDAADSWIALADQLGINQIDFHGGSSFRFGDCEPNPQTYPEGRKSLKRVIDRLHENGISAGLHTYAFFIDKKCPWVTPVPDSRLAKDATFTLAADLTEKATDVGVMESTEKMSTLTGFFVRNSVTLQIEDELITYSAIVKKPPYAFLQCKRGAYDTKISPHPKGAKVHHLKECFGLFVPDGDSTLLTEVAAKTAQTFNECGFDMIYLDALDGEDILGGPENGWHYGSKFVFELFSRLNKSALMEMSTFHHHLWYVRSRMGAWDHPTRGHKRFIDIHCKANESLRRMFLPGHLGWWAVKTWTGIQGEPTFSDDIEYLCGKCIGTDVGLSIMGINPSNCHKPVFQRLAGILKQYEELRRADYFDESVKEKLRIPGSEYALKKDAGGDWSFYPRQYDKHKVEETAANEARWISQNPFDPQPVQLRIEALMSAGLYGAPENKILTDFSSDQDGMIQTAAEGVLLKLQCKKEQGDFGPYIGEITVQNAGQKDAKGAWAKIEIPFEPNLDLSGHQALGLWVHGDGKGEVLNIQLRSPEHLIGGYGERYIVVDFTGWKYCELLEMESERYADYHWPYGSPYSIYRENLQFSHISSLNIWVNNVPPGGEAQCKLSAIKAMPTVSHTIENPAIAIGEKKITFPIAMETGQYLEFSSFEDCLHFGADGDLISEIKPRGEAPLLDRGDNEIVFSHDAKGSIKSRVRVTSISEGRRLE
ncbi:MAG: hypothetical protein JXR73_15535 [Candidatus Omnitrophica bacterium]|nr:hypothetical protein [Candidatus Omnitrophota bacterium]